MGRDGGAMIDKMQDMFIRFRQNVRGVDGDIREQRMSICKECSHLTKHDQCSICYCYMPAKVRFAGSECPIGKWSAVEEKNDGAA